MIDPELLATFETMATVAAKVDAAVAELAAAAGSFREMIATSMSRNPLSSALFLLRQGARKRSPTEKPMISCRVVAA
jgi:hypothetical protein